MPPETFFPFLTGKFLAQKASLRRSRLHNLVGSVGTTSPLIFLANSGQLFTAILF
jgi:hypothetical protein